MLNLGSALMLGFAFGVCCDSGWYKTAGFVVAPMLVLNALCAVI